MTSSDRMLLEQSPAPRSVPASRSQTARPAVVPHPRRRSPQVRRWLRLAVLAALGLLLLAVLVVASLPRPLQIETARVERGPMRVTVDEDGMTRVSERYVVSAPLSGKVLRTQLQPGDTVQERQIIAEISPVASPLLDERTRETARAQLARAQAARRQAAALLSRAAANLELSRSEARRSRTLARSGAIAPAALEAALTRERASSAELESARFAQNVADHEVEMTRASLSRATSAARNAPPEHLAVPAPVAGRVLKRWHESEGVIAAGAPLLEIGDPGTLEIVADVLSTDAVRMAPGNEVSVTRWGGMPLAGRVRRVEPAAFTRLSALGVEEQRVNVIIELISPRALWAALGDAYRVEVSIVVWKSDAVLKVPSSAVFRHAGGWATYRVRDDRAELVRVELGEGHGRELQILRGLKPRDRVVLYPGDEVRDGARVRYEP